jgi:hypothetical protein
MIQNSLSRMVTKIIQANYNKTIFITDKIYKNFLQVAMCLLMLIYQNMIKTIHKFPNFNMSVKLIKKENIKVRN